MSIVYNSWAFVPKRVFFCLRAPSYLRASLSEWECWKLLEIIGADIDSAAIEIGRLSATKQSQPDNADS